MESHVKVNEGSRLWQQFTEGDEWAFEMLMQQHTGLMYQYGSKFSKDENLIKDCIQDVFLYLWDKRSNLNRDVNVKAYLLASLRRRMHRVQMRRINADDIHESRLFDIEFSIEDDIINHEITKSQSKQLKVILDSMPKRQQEVIYLRIYQNIDRDQVAEIMGIAPQTVSNIFQIAIKYIKKTWNFNHFGMVGIISNFLYRLMVSVAAIYLIY